MRQVIIKDGKRYLVKDFNNEADFEKLVVANSKTFFGFNTVLIDSKKKIETQTFGGAIPDCYLIDLSDIGNPEFYIVEVELAKHDFFSHIFPQVTKFFAFFNNQSKHDDLLKKLYTLVTSNSLYKKEIEDRIGTKEIFKYFKDMLENSQNILIVLDKEKEELPEIFETYKETWGKIVKVLLLNEYISSAGDSIYLISPDFENIENVDAVSVEVTKGEKNHVYPEDYHLEGVSPNIKAVYFALKEMVTESMPEVQFNFQRYYVSLRKKRNFAYVRVRKSKIRIVVMEKEDVVRKRIKNYEVRALSESVQKFFSGPCCSIYITQDKGLKEIIELLLDIQK